VHVFQNPRHLSCISVLTVLPAVAALAAPAAQLVSLIKPQFEARREQARASPTCLQHPFFETYFDIVNSDH